MATLVSKKFKRAIKKTKPASDQRGFRADIQGLRALAVVAVIVDHFFHWPGGGFVGVDVFFVISGFLITGLMLREQERHGRISWTGFYRRRIKRIMPAALLVTLVTLVVSYLLFLTEQFQSILGDAVWATLFVSNWHFAATGTDYWEADGPVSPLQHFWSLAVEEQFYIVWPILLVATFALMARRRARTARTALFVIMALLAAASFAWGLHETATNPTVAYFSTFSRAWELALGALLAVAAPLMKNLPAGLRTALSYSGLAVIVAGILVISPSSAFPAPWALLPVVGSALVIAAGIGGTPRRIPLLTNPVSVYLGKISYSLYLWHFPVVIILAAMVPDGTLEFALWASVATLYLSILFFHLVEDPVRRSAWLEPHHKNQRSRKKLEWRRGDGSFLGVPAGGMLAFLAVPAIALSIAALNINDPQETFAVPRAVANQPSEQASEAPSVGPATAEVEQQITAALAAVEWPELTPSTLEDSSADWPADEYGSCLVKDYSRPDGCVFGPPEATKSIAVLGDSLGARLVYLLHQAYPEHKIHGFVRSGCIAIDVAMIPRSAEDGADCLADRASAIEATNSLNPDLVFIVNNSGGVRELESQAQGANASAEWAEGLTRTVSALQVDPSRVVVVSPPPEGKNLDECATRVSTPADCVSPVSPDWWITSAGESSGAEQAGATYLNTLNWFCSPENNCPAFAGTTIIKRDSVHLTAPFLDKLVEPLRESLAEAGVEAS